MPKANKRYQSDQQLGDQWSAFGTSQRNLSEPDDLRQVTFLNSWDDVQKQILRAQNDPAANGHQEFALLTPGLNQLRTFTN